MMMSDLADGQFITLATSLAMTKLCMLLLYPHTECLYFYYYNAKAVYKK